MHQDVEGEMRVHKRAGSEHQRWRFDRVIEGWDAFMEGRPRGACPYASGDFRQLWARGYDEAKKVREEEAQEAERVAELEKRLGVL
jgi:ribosome modulation factor